MEGACDGLWYVLCGQRGEGSRHGIYDSVTAHRLATREAMGGRLATRDALGWLQDKNLQAGACPYAGHMGFGAIDAGCAWLCKISRALQGAGPLEVGLAGTLLIYSKASQDFFREARFKASTTACHPRAFSHYACTWLKITVRRLYTQKL